MIEFIFGAKGSGKTKKMIDMVNEELEHTDGNVLFVNDQDHYRATVDNQIRFINTEEFQINNSNELYGFICGLIASNYDITTIYIDNVLRIIDANGPESIKELLGHLNKLNIAKDIKFVFSISVDEKSAPEFLKESPYKTVTI